MALRWRNMPANRPLLATPLRSRFSKTTVLPSLGTAAVLPHPGAARMLMNRDREGVAEESLCTD
jgi:hypothetical protein